MKIDFKKIRTLNIEKKEEILDLSKPMGNLIYEQTGDIGELDLARDIYYKGEVEISDNQLDSLRNMIGSTNIKAYLKVALLDALKPNHDGTH